MTFIYYCMVVGICMNLGNSLGSTKNQSPSEERYNFFDAELLQVFNQKQNSNVLVSPISIKLILGMLLEGAEDQTAAEIRAALRLPDDEHERRKEFTTWLTALQVKDSPNVLKVANRLFLSNRYAVSSVYGKTLAKHYSGGVTSVEFSDPKEAPRVINGWVGNQTSHLVPSLVEEGQISPDDKLMLASAVYFKGFWSSPFARERTVRRCFHSGGDKCREALMMTETGYFDYGFISRLDARAVVLPYKGGRFSMLLLLPSKRDGVHLLARDLLHVSLGSILSELKEQEVLVQIPRFEVGFNDDLVETLKTVQILNVFTPRANLSRMLATHLDSASVSHVYHSAKIIVNEEGSEAAAVTGALFVPLMGGTTTSFVADRPFLFFVMSSAKNSILFAGKILSPQPADDPKHPNLPLPANPHRSQYEKTQNPVPTLKQDTSRGSANESTLVEKTRDLKNRLRGPQAGPKFRSIKPGFSSPRLHSAERKTGSQTQHENPPLDLPSHRALPPPHPEVFFETQNFKKRGKNVQEPSKNRKRQEPLSDDWRHHILFFT